MLRLIGHNIPSNQTQHPVQRTIQPIIIETTSKSMLSAHFDKIIQRRSRKRYGRCGSSSTNFHTIEPREMKNFDIINAVEANIPEPTLNIFKSFFENTNLIHGAENVIIQGISKSQCAYFILFYMIKHSDKRLCAALFEIHGISIAISSIHSLITLQRRSMSSFVKISKSDRTQLSSRLRKLPPYHLFRNVWCP
jgi:hypothetical protein